MKTIKEINEELEKHINSQYVVTAWVGRDRGNEGHKTTSKIKAKNDIDAILKAHTKYNTQFRDYIVEPEEMETEETFGKALKDMSVEELKDAILSEYDISDYNDHVYKIEKDGVVIYEDEDFDESEFYDEDDWDED